MTKTNTLGTLALPGGYAMHLHHLVLAQEMEKKKKEEEEAAS